MMSFLTPHIHAILRPWRRVSNSVLTEEQVAKLAMNPRIHWLFWFLNTPPPPAIPGWRREAPSTLSLTHPSRGVIHLINFSVSRRVSILDADYTALAISVLGSNIKSHGLLGSKSEISKHRMFLHRHSHHTVVANVVGHLWLLAFGCLRFKVIQSPSWEVKKVA